MIEGISHITFVVQDLERTSMFLRKIFDAEEVYSSGDKLFSISGEKFFIIGGQWIAIMKGEPLSSRTYNHIAFKVREEDFDKYEARVRAIAVDIKAPRKRIDGEGRSLYFYDFDNHLFELHTGTLSERIIRYSSSNT